LIRFCKALNVDMDLSAIPHFELAHGPACTFANRDQLHICGFPVSAGPRADFRVGGGGQQNTKQNAERGFHRGMCF
jgi:hypothetical protein